MHDQLAQICLQRNDIFPMNFKCHRTSAAEICNLLPMSRTAEQCDWIFCHHGNNGHFHKRERNEKLSWLKWFIYINIKVVLLLFASVLKWDDSGLSSEQRRSTTSLLRELRWNIFVWTRGWQCWWSLWLEFDYFDVWEVNFMHKAVVTVTVSFSSPLFVPAWCSAQTSWIAYWSAAPLWLKA